MCFCACGPGTPACACVTALTVPNQVQPSVISSFSNVLYGFCCVVLDGVQRGWCADTLVVGLSTLQRLAKAANYQLAILLVCKSTVFVSCYAGGICAAADNKVQCFGLGSPSTLLQMLAMLEVKQHGIADICIRPDQRLFATAGWDGKVRLFHHKKMRPLAILQVRMYGLAG